MIIKNGKADSFRLEPISGVVKKNERWRPFVTGRSKAEGKKKSRDDEEKCFKMTTTTTTTTATTTATTTKKKWIVNGRFVDRFVSFGRFLCQKKNNKSCHRLEFYF